MKSAQIGFEFPRRMLGEAVDFPVGLPESFVLQAWVAADVNHRLDTGKLAEILAVASRHFPIGDLEVEIEYEDDVLSQFPVENFSVEDETVWFRLTSRHTDCLAKDQCGVEDGCCGEDAGSDCCATA